MLNFTLLQEWDHHATYHQSGMKTDWCRFCSTFPKEHRTLDLFSSLQCGERRVSDDGMGDALAAVGPRVSGRGGPR